jgi:hypothetical protein
MTHVAVAVDHDDFAAASPQLEPNRASHDATTNDADSHGFMIRFSALEYNPCQPAKVARRSCNWMVPVMPPVYQTCGK